MKVDEKNIENLLLSIKFNLEEAYNTTITEMKDEVMVKAIGQLEALLSIIDFE